MIKKFFSLTGVLTLICFSFYYTDSAVNIVKRNDPIMKEIQSVMVEYEQKSIDATLIDNNIIPGICGLKVNADKSYEKMKKYGSFDEGLLVFEEFLPTINISNNYDKYIVKGNSSKQSVSLVFLMEDTFYIDDILSVLKEKEIKVNFFVTSQIINNDIDVLEKIFLNGHYIELLSDNYEKNEVKRANKIIKNLTNSKMNYCYSEHENDILISNCKNSKMHSIMPTIITSSFPYNDIKNNVTSGSIISLDNNISLMRELIPIINYLNQKGYDIITLNELLDE
ncbi:MAG: hypothetical protein IJO43_02550 [Bacilli bacterium]|nr:hypothetical protein [Bacilli bacterium]